jgi:hypothetical protein
MDDTGEADVEVTIYKCNREFLGLKLAWGQPILIEVLRGFR